MNVRRHRPKEVGVFIYCDFDAGCFLDVDLCTCCTVNLRYNERGYTEYLGLTNKNWCFI